MNSLSEKTTDQSGVKGSKPLLCDRDYSCLTKDGIWGTCAKEFRQPESDFQVNSQSPRFQGSKAPSQPGAARPTPICYLRS